MSVNGIPPAGGPTVPGLGGGTPLQTGPQVQGAGAAAQLPTPVGLQARRAPAMQGVRITQPLRLARLPARRAAREPTAPEGSCAPDPVPTMPAPASVSTGGRPDAWRMQQQMQESMAQQQYTQMQWQVQMGQMDMLRRLADAFGGAAKAVGDSIARLVGN